MLGAQVGPEALGALTLLEAARPQPMGSPPLVTLTSLLAGVG